MFALRRCQSVDFSYLLTLFLSFAVYILGWKGLCFTKEAWLAHSRYDMLMIRYQRLATRDGYRYFAHSDTPKLFLRQILHTLHFVHKTLVLHSPHHLLSAQVITFVKNLSLQYIPTQPLLKRDEVRFTFPPPTVCCLADVRMPGKGRAGWMPNAIALDARIMVMREMTRAERGGWKS
jgi:hypothetical protein